MDGLSPDVYYYFSVSYFYQTQHVTVCNCLTGLTNTMDWPVSADPFGAIQPQRVNRHQEDVPSIVSSVYVCCAVQPCSRYKYLDGLLRLLLLPSDTIAFIKYQWFACSRSSLANACTCRQRAFRSARIDATESGGRYRLCALWAFLFFPVSLFFHAVWAHMLALIFRCLRDR